MNKQTGTKRTKKPLVAAIAFATSIMAAPIYAQTSESADSDEGQPPTLEEVTVYGIRNSLMQALEEKRNSSEIMDAISAEDIGQLPDDNIAEALRRVTGIAITRDTDGEGENLQLRGRANRNIQINGVPIAVTSEDNRGINFSDYSSSMFEGLEVFKTARADKPEGGLGGSINLKTRKPSSLKGPTGVFTVADKISRATENDQPQGDLLLGNSWKTEYGKFGVLGSAAYSEVDSRGDTVVVNRYSAYQYGSGGRSPFADVNGDGLIDTDDNVFYPSGYRARAKFKSSERLGGQLAFDWTPNENWHLMFEGSSFQKDELRRQPQVGLTTGRNVILSVDDPMNPNVLGRVVNILGGDGNTVPFYGLAAGSVAERRDRDNDITVNMNSDSYTDEQSDTTTLLFKTTYKTDGYKLQTQISQSKAEVEVLSFDTRYRYNDDIDGDGRGDGMTYDFDLTRGDQFFFAPTLAGSPLDATSVANLDWRDVERNYTERESTKNDFRIDFTDYVEFGPIKSYKLGIRLAEDQNNKKAAWRETTGLNISAGDPVFDQCTGPLGLDNVLGGALGNGLFSDFVANNCSYGELSSALGLSDIRIDDNVRLTAIDKVTESVDSVYAMIEFEQPLSTGDMAISGNFGVRYSQIDVTSEGSDGVLVLDADGNPTRDGAGDLISTTDPVKFTHDYSYVLPSLNVNLRLREDLFLRFGAAKVVQTPDIKDLRPGTNWANGGNLDGIDFEARRGNPALEPKEAYAYDLSLEWYFAEGGLLSIAPFLKDWQVNTENRVIFEDIGNETIAIRTPVDLNAEYGKQWGVELGYQHEFTFLPGILRHTGINANYTYVDIEDDLSSLTVEGIPRAFQHRIARNSYNTSLWYDDGRLSARIAYSWRNDWEIGVVPIVDDQRVVPGATGSLNMNQKEIGVLDVSLNYQVTDALKLNFSAVNLNDDLKENYSNYEEIPRGSSWSGTSYKLSLKYTFL